MAASYPSSVKTFTTKNTGDTIQGTHVNDLQDEVTAIEGGILNGTAPLNSSNSTLANLTVAGGSTLASLNVTAGSTLAKLSVTGGSTLGTVNAGASTVTNLSAGASTFSGSLLPATDSTYALGSTSKRWIIDGAQITPGSIPSTSLSTTGTPSTATYLSGGGWQAVAASPVTRLTASADSGTDSSTSATNLATVAMSGLTVKDSLRVVINLSATVAAVVAPSLYHATDGVALDNVASGGGNVAVAKYLSVYTIRPDQSASTSVSLVGIRSRSDGTNDVGGRTTGVTTAWTNPWSLALRTGGSTTGGVLAWAWSVYKHAGQ